MSENPLSPLGKFIPDVRHYDDVDTQSGKWESTRVEGTVRKLKLNVACLRHMKRDSFGNLSFETFNDYFAGFPMILGASALPELPALHRNEKAIHPLWFKSFTSLPFIKFYEDLLHRYGTRDSDHPVGLVFPRKGFRDGMILHNGHLDTYVGERGSCHLFRGKQDRRLIVQPYSAFLDRIRDYHEWTPNFNK